MTTTDRETLDIFERTLRGVFVDQDGEDASRALEQIGWRDFLAADAPSVVPMVFSLLGELLVSSTALDDVAFAAVYGDDERWITAAAGTAFAHPRAGVVAGSLTDGELTVDALVLDGRHDVPVALVAAAGDRLRVVTVAADALESVAVGGIDPAMGLVRVRGVVPSAAVVTDDHLVPAAVAEACRRALAYELVGLSTQMLAGATEYAKVRMQFGQPIGAFQAVKHRLADVYVAVRAAGVVIDESWRSDPELTTAAAKSLAARAFALASENCLQVLGAIGFTLEHDLHRFIRRGKVLDRLYGSERELRTELGRGLQAAGRMPRPGTP